MGQWTRALRTRKQCDIIWVVSLETPSWSIEITSLRDDIRNTAREFALSTAIVDRLRWETCVGTEFLSNSKTTNVDDECPLYSE